MVAEAIDPRRLLFVDECGTHTSRRRTLSLHGDSIG
jgi:hypothetical protein